LNDKVRNSRIVIVAHRCFPSIVDDLKEYLVENRCRELFYIIHEFSELENRRSFYEHYRDGELVEEHYSLDYRFIKDPLVNIKDFLYTLFWLMFRVRGGIDIYIGLGGFNVVCGTLLKRIKRIRNVVYYTVDYVPERFESRFLNELYHLIDRFEVAHSTETWNVSPRMAEGRAQVRGLTGEEYSRQKVVPIGFWFDKIVRYPVEQINRSELVFIGHLYEKQGVQVVLRAVPRIASEIPDFTFRVIGTGPFEQQLKEIARDPAIGSHVIFEGAVPDQDEVNRKLARAALAVALYDRRTDDWSYYADPGKIKVYLSVGLPVLSTDLPYNAGEIEKRGCGEVLEYDEDSVAEAVIGILGNENKLREYHRNVVEYASRFDWNRILDDNLGELL
jgi:glycosyltransferase involved in cell wall biosynthesis